MLKRINNKSVCGPNFTVRVTNIHQIEYIEDGKIASIEIEGGINDQGQVEWLVYAKTFRGWMPPHDAEKLIVKEIERILENVSQSLNMLDMRHKIVWQ